DQPLCARLCHTNCVFVHCPSTGTCYPFVDQSLCAHLCHTNLSLYIAHFRDRAVLLRIKHFMHVCVT
ncbi:hypothetical protein LINPERHAP1_LOCUS11554, partial [Linum perenne]